MREQLIGQLIEDRYLVEAELGCGAMGRVFRARHIKVGREVAVKVLHTELLDVPALVERFEREGRIAARLRHPNLVAVLDVGATAGGRPLMVLELARGCELSDLITGPLDRERVISFADQLLRGLDHAHAAGLVHRDLKPGNVLVETTAAGEVARIVDFGIAMLRERGDITDGRRLTDAGLVIGTPAYMAPEQAFGRELDHRADLFALGVIVYEMLCGEMPFEGSGVDIAFASCTKDPPPIAERVPGLVVDPQLEAFARTLMARRLEDRFPSARAALDALVVIASVRESLPTIPIAPVLDPVRLEAPPFVLPRPAAPARDVHSTAAMLALCTTPPRRFRAWPIAALAVLTIAMAGAWSARRPATAPAPSPAPHGIASIAPTAVEVAPIAVAPPALVTAITEPVRRASPIAKRTPRVQPRPVTLAVAAPPPVASPVPAPAPALTADLVAQRYTSVGRKLTTCASDKLWQRYRLIRVLDAIATPASRQRAYDELESIAQAAAGCVAQPRSNTSGSVT